MLKNIVIILVVAIAGFLGYAATRPATYQVERSTRIEAPPAVIFKQLDDLRLWAEWSPWDKLDPQLLRTFEGPATGVGSAYLWQGNKDVGKGKMTIVESTPPVNIAYRLEFMEPFAAVAQARFQIAPDGTASNVTWHMDGTNNFMSKVVGIFMNMEKAIGGDFERGLASLKTVAEAEAAKQPATPLPDAAVEPGVTSAPAADDEVAPPH